MDKRNSLLEALIKRLIIQEYIVILELFVEAVLHLFHAGHDTINIGVTGCTNYHEQWFAQYYRHLCHRV